MPDPKMPTRADTVASMLVGLRPYAGDWHDFVDGLESLLDAMRCWAHLLLRIVMMAAFPLTLIVLYPMVRAAERKQHERDLQREKRRAEMVSDLTKACAKPVEWPSHWQSKDTYGEALKPVFGVKGLDDAQP